MYTNILIPIWGCIICANIWSASQSPVSTLGFAAYMALAGIILITEFKK